MSRNSSTERTGGSGRDVLSGCNALEVLRSKGAEFWIENGVLRYRVPKGQTIPDDVRALSHADQKLLSSLLHRGAVRPRLRVLERPDPMRAPLGFSQLGHWHGQAAVNHRPIRQVASAIRMRGRLEIAALQEALSVVVGRHEALRTRVVVLDGEPAQEIAAHSSCGLQIRNLTAVPPRDRAKEVQRQITRAIVDVADYAVDPLCTTVLLTLGPDEHVLILAMDHIVSDGASLTLVLDELLTVYERLVSGSRGFLPPVRMQLADYAFWQRTELAGWLERRRSEWTARRLIRFPAESPVTGIQGWDVVRFTLDAPTKSALQEWARYQKTSLTMTVLTAYISALLRYCDASEAIIQFISDGRISSLLEQTVGDITFPLFLRIPCDAHATFVGLLECLTQQYCLACEEPEFAYGFIQDPLPEWVRNTSFNWIPERGDHEECRPAEPTVLTYSRMTFEHPALEALEWDGEPNVTFWEAGREVIGEVGFPRMRFSQAAMKRFTGTFQTLLHSLLVAPTKRIRDIALTDA